VKSSGENRRREEGRQEKSVCGINRGSGGLRKFGN